MLPYHLEMKGKLLTRKQVSSIACPTCGVAVGERCKTGAGGLRFLPHADRKILAAEAVEKRLTKEDTKGMAHDVPTA
jgi:hypothetical protein